MHTLIKITSITLIYNSINLSLASAREPNSTPLLETLSTDSTIKGSTYLGWESRYFSEGRDALDGDSLLISSAQLAWNQLSTGILYAYSPDQSYDELQLSLALTQNIGDLEFSLGYTHFRFPSDSAHDNEIGIGITWNALPMDIELSSNIYYSFDAGGYFAELSASKDFSITDQLTLNTSIPFGINQGYIPDGHDGANNIALQLNLEYTLSKSISLSAHSTYSWAINRDASAPGDDQLTNFFHTGIGIQWSF